MKRTTTQFMLTLALGVGLSMVTVLPLTMSVSVTHAAPLLQSGGTRYVATTGQNIRSYNDGAWHHVAVVKEGSTLRVYIDGALGEEQTVSGSFNQPMDLYIGGRETDVNFNGQLDDVAVFNRSLSAAEVNAHASATIPAGESGNLLLLRFNETVVTTRFDDSSAQNNDGRCRSSTFVNTCPSGPLSGRFSNTVSFDGSDYITLTNAVNFGQADFTVEGWFKTGTAGEQLLLVATESGSNNPGLTMGLNNESKIEVTYTAGANSTEIIPPNNCADSAYPCGTIQYAVDIATAGDIIKVASGTYSDLFTRTRTDVQSSEVVTQVVYITKSLTLEGGYNASFSSAAPGTTIINSSGQGRAVYATGNISLTMDGFRVESGNAQDAGGHVFTDTDAGSGLYIYQLSNFTLRNSTVQDNFVSGQGGGLYLAEVEQAVLADNLFTNNQAPNLSYLKTEPLDAPLIVTSTNPPQIVLVSEYTLTITGTGGALYAISSTMSMQNNNFSNNLAGVNGGAIYIENSELQAFTGNTLQNNRAKDGGGLYVLAEDNSITLSDNRFEGNRTSSGDGGAAYLQTKIITLSNNIIRNNFVLTGSGGGLYIVTNTFTLLEDNTIENNRINYYDSNDKNAMGGGVHLESKEAVVRRNLIQNNETHGHGGGIYLKNISDLTFTENTVKDNKTKYELFTELVTILEEPYVITEVDPPETIEAGPQYSDIEVVNNGGGVYLSSSSGVFTNNIVQGNQSALDGGGIYLDRASSLKFYNNLVVQNSATVSRGVGSGIYVGKSNPEMVHNTIADNINPSTGYSFGVYVARDGEVTMRNNIIANHDFGVEFDGSGVVEGSDNVWYNNRLKDWGTRGFKGPADHYFGDPNFADAGNGDYTLRGGSVAYDVGTDFGLSSDLDGGPRVRGFQPDAGAYELQYTRGLHVQQSYSEGFVGDGTETIFTIKLANHSSAAVSGVQVVNDLAAQLSIQSISASQGNCSGSVCNLGTINPETTVEITMRVQASGKPPTQDALLPLSNVATLNFNGLDPADSDTEAEATVYLREIFDPSTSRMARATNPIYTGQCSISMNGRYYSSIKAATEASLRNDDVVRVSGYCGETLELRAPEVQIEPWDITIEGGWPTNSAAMPADFETSLDTYPTTLDGGAQGSVLRFIGEFGPTIKNLIVTNGDASGGGGVYIDRASVTLDNLWIKNNKAVNGGGVYIDELSAPIINGTIIENNSVRSRGGGMYVRKGGAEIEKSIIRNNTGASDGGGIYLQEANPTFREVTVSGHSVSGQGGGLYLESAPATFENGEISNNKASAGGGVFAFGSAATFQKNRIANNEATNAPDIFINLLTGVIDWVIAPGGGGGIHAAEGGVTVNQNVFERNKAKSGDGQAVHLAFGDQGSTKIDGNVFLNHSGTAVFIWTTPSVFKFYVPQYAWLNPALLPGLDFFTPVPLQETPVLIRHNTFRFNKIGLHVYGRSSAELINNLFAENSTGILAEDNVIPHLILIILFIFGPIPVPLLLPTYYAPAVSHDYSLMYENNTHVESKANFGLNLIELNGSNQVSGNPYFQADGYHIKRISAAFEGGKNTDVKVDIDNDSRPEGNFSDIGADEYIYRSTHYVVVNPAQDGLERCTNWQTPCSLQTAIDASDDGDLIKIAAGEYDLLLPAPDDDGLMQIAYISRTVTLQGGYNVADTNTGDDDFDQWEVPLPAQYPTILNANGGGRVVFVEGEGNHAELFGLEITNGAASGLGGGPTGADVGGGVFALTATVTISDSKLYENRATHGGGSYLYGNSESGVVRSIFRNNQATQKGGGLYAYQSKVNMEEAQFTVNTAPHGGGLYGEEMTGQIDDGQIFANTATDGAGAYFLDSDVQTSFRNTAVYANEASGNGGGFYMDNSGIEVLTGTFRSNIATSSGGGMYLTSGSGPAINYSTVEENKARTGAGIFAKSESGFSFNEGVVQKNIATENGGGLYVEASGPRVDFSLITENEARDGGGMYFDLDTTAVNSTTISLNKASRNGAGVSMAPFSQAQINRSTIINNTADLDGGGVYSRLTDLAGVNSSTVATNTARYGAGFYVTLGVFEVLDNAIYNNQASLDGGGLYIQEVGEKANFTNNNIVRNTARSGAGLYTFVMPGTIESNSISTNTATVDGGGLYADSSPLIFDKNQVFGNQTLEGSGGGLFLAESAATVRENRIFSNLSVLHGGGVQMQVSPATFEQNYLLDNQAVNGAAFYLHNSDPRLINTVIMGNEASDTASGVFLFGSNPQLIHTTFNGNRGANDGTGVHVAANGPDSSTALLTNTIIYGQQIGLNVAGGNSAMLYNTLWHNNDSNTSGTGNIQRFADNTGDPQFLADGYQLNPDSNAVDRGVTVSGVGVDILGNVRPFGEAVDIGAVEYGVFCFAVVDREPDIIYNTVQEALDAATAGDVVKVAGICREVTTRSGLTQVALVDKSLTLRGGYSSVDWQTYDPTENVTLLDADEAGRVVVVTSGEPSIEGFSMTKGDAGRGGGVSGGGAIYVVSGTPTISRNLIYGNNGAGAGGALYVNGHDVTFTTNTVAENMANYGGALYLKESAGQIINSKIIRNEALFDGGGIFVDTGATLVTRTLITGNKSINGGGIFATLSPNSMVQSSMISVNIASSTGGGVYLNKSGTTMTDTLVQGNQANDGAGVYADDSAAQFSLMTVTLNIASGNGGGVHLKLSGDTELDRVSVTSNEAANGGGFYMQDSPATINGQTVLKNKASASGGGFFVDKSDATLTNNIIGNNEAMVNGSGLYLRASAVTLQHNTIVRNRAEEGDATGLYLTSLSNTPSSVTMVNTILAMHETGLYLAENNTATLEGTVWGNQTTLGGVMLANETRWAGAGTASDGAVSLEINPLFWDSEAPDYHILEESGAVNAGVETSLTTDIDGDTRPRGSGPDIGADEATTRVMAVSQIPTIRTNGTGGGDWNEPSTWLEQRVPEATDIALIQTGDSVTATEISVVGLNNNGTLRSPQDEAMNITLGQALENVGDILGHDGQDGTGDTNGTDGSSIVVQAATVNNTGKIIGGDGGACEDGAGGAGGTADVTGDAVTNDGEIRGGAGGSCTGGADGAGGNGGSGGNANVDAANTLDNNGTIAGGNGGDGSAGDGIVEGADDGDGGNAIATAGQLDNSGLISGGDGAAGGDAMAAATDDGNGVAVNTGTISGGDSTGGDGAGDGAGDGGDAMLLADGAAINNNGVVAGGQGDDTVGQDGQPVGVDGDAIISGQDVTVSGAGSAISGENVSILGGDGGTVALNGLGSPAIAANTAVDIGVDGDGKVDLSGNDQQPIISADPEGDGGAGAGTTIATDNLLIPGSQSLADLAGDNAVQESGGPSYAHTALGPGPASTGPGGSIQLGLTLANIGSMADTYSLAVGGAQQFTVGSFPDTLSMAGQSISETTLSVVAPGVVLSPIKEVLWLTMTSTALPAHGVVVKLEVSATPYPYATTIRSIRTGNWDDPTTWEPERVPTVDDVVLVRASDTVMGLPEINITGLRNEGTILCPAPESLSIQAEAFLENLGLITGLAGKAGSGSTPGAAGCSLTLAGSPLVNQGEIVGGPGSGGETGGGTGGAVTLLAEDLFNEGTIAGGSGGPVTGLGLGAAGDGGPVTLVGNLPDDGMVVNKGTVAGGAGGDTNPDALNEQTAGDGGAVTILGKPEVLLTGSQSGGAGGAGGAGDPPADDGAAGDLTIAGDKIAMSGLGSGENIKLLGGDDALVDLTGLAAGALQAASELAVELGANSTVDLRGSGQPALQAGQQATLAATQILLTSPATLAAVAGDNAVQVGPGLPYQHLLLGSTVRQLPPSSTLTVGLLLLNLGPDGEGYQVRTGEIATWQLSQLSSLGASRNLAARGLLTAPVSARMTTLLPSSARQMVHAQTTVAANVSGQEDDNLALSMTIPADAISGTQQTLVVTAVSTLEPERVMTATIEVQVVAREVTPTIQTITSGPWGDPDTWDLDRVPNEEDVALVNPGHEVAAPEQVVIAGLINRGVIEARCEGPLYLTVESFLENYGQILGCNGLDGDADVIATPGSSLIISGGSLLNEASGLIQAGHGGQGLYAGAAGGSVGMLAQNLSNYGTIMCGDGGDVYGNQADATGGDSGDILLTASVAGEGAFRNEGVIGPCRGGDGSATATTPQQGGQGGNLLLIGNPAVNLDGGQASAGLPGNSVAGASAAAAGSLAVGAEFVSAAGADSRLNGDDIKLMSCNGGQIVLSNATAAAVQVRSMQLAVDQAGLLDLSGNPHQVVQAEESVTLAGPVALADGYSLAQVVGSNHQQTGGDCLPEAGLLGPGMATISYGGQETLSLSALNGGLVADSFRLTVEDIAGWDLSVPDEVTVSPVAVVDVPLQVRVPTATPYRFNLITVRAISNRDGQEVGRAVIFIRVSSEVYLPIVAR